MKTVGLKPALIITFLVQALALAATTVQAGDFTTLTGIQLAGALINLAGVIFVGPGQVTDQPDAPEPPHPELPHHQEPELDPKIIDAVAAKIVADAQRTPPVPPPIPQPAPAAQPPAAPPAAPQP